MLVLNQNMSLKLGQKLSQKRSQNKSLPVGLSSPHVSSGYEESKLEAASLHGGFSEPVFRR